METKHLLSFFCIVSLVVVVLFYKYHLRTVISKFIALVTIVILTAVLYQQLFVSQERFDTLFRSDTFLGKAAGIFLYSLFLFAALGITLAGIKAIKDKETIALAPPGTSHETIKGKMAVIEGIIYISIGITFLAGVLQVGKIIFFE